MRRRLFLHLGPAKTGTSAIQHVLSQHDGSVVLYPKVGLWDDGSHHNLVLNFFGEFQRPEMEREDVGYLLARIADEARASDRDLVISSEILAGRKNIRDFANAIQTAVGCELRLVCVVVAREYRERVASLYNQRVKDAVFLERRSPDEFVTEHPERFCYAPLLQRLKSAGLDVTVVNYHPADDLVARCLAVFGFAPEQISRAPNRNVSLGQKALAATLAANRAAQSCEERAAFDAAVAGMAKRFSSPRPFFSEAAIAKVRRTFAADRKFLRQRLGVKLPKPEKPGRESALTISESEFAEIAALTGGLGDYGGRIRECLRHCMTCEPSSTEGENQEELRAFARSPKPK